MPISAHINSHLSSGLSSQKTVQLLHKYGENTIETQTIPSDLHFFFAQFKNPLVLVLLISALITLFLKDPTDTIVISLAIFINTILGFIQEKKAFTSMHNLKNAITTSSWVIRDRQKKQVDSKNLVKGDLVCLYAGDKIPADGLILQNNNLLINEAIITGESASVEKTPHPLNLSDNAVDAYLDLNFDKISNSFQVFMGSNVVNGSGLVLVTKTGYQTQMGKIAQEIDEHKNLQTPLEKRLNNLARFLTIGVVIVSICLFLYGIASGRNFTEMFTISVALAVAAIPEGLIVALTTILAVGMQRILKKNALVRNLMAAETLGSVTCICIDKTGTLTEGNLKIKDTYFANTKLAYIANLVANDGRDSLEIARIKWAQYISSKHSHFPSPNKIATLYPKDDQIPFSSETRFLATLSGKEIFLSGSPEELMQKSSLNPNLVQKYQNLIENCAGHGQRLIALAYIKNSSITKAQSDFAKLKNNKFTNIKLSWLGLISFVDPVRKDVKKTISKAMQAGLTFKIITGDYITTAVSVANQIDLDIKDNEIIDGKYLKTLSQKKLQSLVKTTKLFVRTTPSQKLRIVQALKANHEVVAMMGDGVNDAPALAAADIGIVVKEASDISKDTADMVLLDSKLKTIIHAIEEGRGIFDNLRKVILYLLSDTFSEIILIVSSLILNWPMMITAAQILWINLIDDGLPSLALTINPKSNDLLKRKPISVKESLINSQTRTLIFIASIVSAGVSLLVFKYTYKVYDLQIARTLVFTILSLDSLLYVFSCKSLQKNVWEEPLFNNIYLVLASLVGLFLTIIAIYNPLLSSILGLSPIPLNLWPLIIISSFFVMLSIETYKLFQKNKKFILR